LLEKISSDTCGIMIYQEQVMAAAASLAGYTLGQSDLLRRAMGKKDKEKMAKERALFVEGCARTNGIKEKKANAIFDLLEKFAGYGFNKSHSAAYGWVSYQTAYLKANYAVEFMAAVLSNEINNTEKISTFVSECNRMGITILPPDINRSALKFCPEVADGKQGIRFGLAAVKNVGEGAMQAAIIERESGGEFKSLEQFCARVDSRKVNRKVLESLVKAGAFDFCGLDRSILFSQIDSAMSASAVAHRDRAIGQVSLFDELQEPVTSKPTSLSLNFVPWTLSEKLTFEKDLLGFYVTGHPLEEYRSVLENGTCKSVADLGELEDKSTVKLAGSLTSVDRKFTKKDGKPFAILMLEDLTGSVEVMVWSEAFTKYSNYLETGKVVSITGRLDKREDASRIVASEVRPVAAVREEPVRLQFQRSQTSARDLERVRNTLVEFPGSRPVLFEFVWDDGRRISLRAGERFKVNWLPELQERLSPFMS
jgi:DNA polymerase-3 subunit alpha